MSNSSESLEIGQKNCIIETLAAIKHRNAELKELLAYQRQENLMYKHRYRDLTEKINNVNGWLEKTVQTFYTLFEDTKDALHMGRAAQLGQVSPEPVSKHVPNPKLGPPALVTTRKKLHIERIQLKELEQSLEGTEEHTIPTSQIEEDNIATISKTNSDDIDPKTKLKELYVRLSRLPSHVVEQCLNKNKQCLSCSESSLNLTKSFAVEIGAGFTSTPLKLETMKNLGLCPTNSIFEFCGRLSIRKSVNNVRNDRRVKRSLIKTEKESPIVKKKRMQEKGTPNVIKSKAKKSVTPKAAIVVRSPKVRRARPLQLKEESLKKKKRAE